VVESVAVLTEHLFREGPLVHIVATTREALRVEGENIYLLSAPRQSAKRDQTDSVRGADLSRGAGLYGPSRRRRIPARPHRRGGAPCGGHLSSTRRDSVGNRASSQPDKYLWYQRISTPDRRSFDAPLAGAA